MASSLADSFFLSKVFFFFLSSHLILYYNYVNVPFNKNYVNVTHFFLFFFFVQGTHQSLIQPTPFCSSGNLSFFLIPYSHCFLLEFIHILVGIEFASSYLAYWDYFFALIFPKNEFFKVKGIKFSPFLLENKICKPFEFWVCNFLMHWISVI